MLIYIYIYIYGGGGAHLLLEHEHVGPLNVTDVVVAMCLVVAGGVVDNKASKRACLLQPFNDSTSTRVVFVGNVS